MEELKQKLEKDIYKIVQELKRCTNKKRHYKLISSCEDLTTIASLKDIDINIPKELDFELIKRDIDDIDEKYINLVYDNAVNMYPYNRRFCNMVEKFDTNLFSNRNLSKKVNFNDSMSLANDFFQNYDKDLYKYFKKITNSANFFIIDQMIENMGISCYGLTYSSNDLMKSYIHVTKRNEIIDYLTIIHEVIHAYIKDLQRYISFDEEDQELLNNLQEVYSNFIELVAMKYLSDIKYNKEEIRCLKEINDNYMINHILNFKVDIEEEFDCESYVLDESYAYGSVLSYHFYEKYRQEEQKTKDNILNFMLESKEHDKFYMLNHYGLNKNDIINSQKLKKCMKNLEKDLKL